MSRTSHCSVPKDRVPTTGHPADQILCWNPISDTSRRRVAAESTPIASASPWPLLAAPATCSHRRPSRVRLDPEQTRSPYATLPFRAGNVRSQSTSPTNWVPTVLAGTCDAPGSTAQPLLGGAHGPPRRTPLPPRRHPHLAAFAAPGRERTRMRPVPATPPRFAGWFTPARPPEPVMRPASVPDAARPNSRLHRRQPVTALTTRARSWRQQVSFLPERHPRRLARTTVDLCALHGRLPPQPDRDAVPAGVLPQSPRRSPRLRHRRDGEGPERGLRYHRLIRGDSASHTSLPPR